MVYAFQIVICIHSFDTEWKMKQEQDEIEIYFVHSSLKMVGKNFTIQFDKYLLSNEFDDVCAGNEGDDCEPDYDCDADYEGDNVARKFPDEECDRDVVGNTLTVQSIILQRWVSDWIQLYRPI